MYFRSQYEKDIALLDASKDNHLQTVKKLINCGANIHIKNDLPLINAIIRKDLGMVKYLIERGANIHAKNESPLIYASFFGDLEIIKYLVQKGANIHYNHYISLQIATYMGWNSVVKYLAEQLDNRFEALKLASRIDALPLVIYLVQQEFPNHIDMVLKLINQYRYMKKTI